MINARVYTCNNIFNTLSVFFYTIYYSIFLLFIFTIAAVKAVERINKNKKIIKENIFSIIRLKVLAIFVLIALVITTLFIEVFLFLLTLLKPAGVLFI